MFKLPFAAFLLMSLVACDFVGETSKIFEERAYAAQAIRKQYGWDAEVGVSVVNGNLAEATLYLNAKDVRGESVENLERIASEIFLKTFTLKPETILIQIITMPIDS